MKNCDFDWQINEFMIYCRNRILQFNKILRVFLFCDIIQLSARRGDEE